MQYLSKDIEAVARKRKQQEKSLIKMVNSCGIFQDYGSTENELNTEVTVKNKAR